MTLEMEKGKYYYAEVEDASYLVDGDNRFYVNILKKYTGLGVNMEYEGWKNIREQTPEEQEHYLQCSKSKNYVDYKPSIVNNYQIF